MNLTQNNFHDPNYKYILYLDKKYNRDEIKNRLKKEFNISLPGEVYAEACHKQPVFKKYKNLVVDKGRKFPGADHITANQICLPLYPSLAIDEVLYIVDSFKALLNKY